jgi:hypothetical protein
LGLRKALSRATTGRQTAEATTNELLERYDALCGDPLGFYGLSAREELSVRKAKSIPVQATIYDLFNFASEAATHHLHSRGAKDRVNVWIGQRVTREFDLEGTVDIFPDYADYFLAQGSEGASDLDLRA